MSTDAQVLRDLIDAFKRIPGLNSSRLYVDVKSRIVTIRGRVQSASQRQEVTLAARGIVGLRALVLEVGVASAPKVFAVTENDITDKALG
jgi:osmotically-inducible protein OsmY